MSELNENGEIKKLRDQMQATPIDSQEGKKLLTRFLSSVAKGSIDGRLLVARAVYGIADDLEEPKRSLILEQIFHALMRSLEDYASLCLMWMDPSENPLKIFMGTDKASIRQFYTRARKGLGDEGMLQIFGLASPETLVKRGLVQKGDQYILESVVGWAVNKYKRLLEAFGRVYHSTVDEADPVIGAWQISYAMSPMGTKMLLNDEGRPEELLLGVGELEGDKVGIYRTAVSVDSRFGEESLHHVENVCREIRDLAQLHLALLTDPGAGLARAQKRFEMEFKSLGKDEEVGVPEGIRIKRELPLIEKTIKEDENKNSQITSAAKPLESHEVKQIGGLKITHSVQIKNDD